MITWLECNRIPSAASFGQVPDGFSTAMMVPTPFLSGHRGGAVSVAFSLVGPDRKASIFVGQLTSTLEPVVDSLRLLLTPGQAGFDRDGLLPATVLTTPDETTLYYSGFERLSHQPHRLLTGVAVIRGSGTERSERAWLGATEEFSSVRAGATVDPAAGCVTYAGGSDWAHEADGSLHPVTRIVRAELSDNNVVSGDRAIDLALVGEEYAHTRPIPFGEHLLFGVRQTNGSYSQGSAALTPSGWVRTEQHWLIRDRANIEHTIDDSGLIYFAPVPTSDGLIATASVNRSGGELVLLEFQGPAD